MLFVYLSILYFEFAIFFFLFRRQVTEQTS